MKQHLCKSLKKKQGQTVHKLQIATFWDLHNSLGAFWDPLSYLGPPELFWTYQVVVIIQTAAVKIDEKQVMKKY